MDSRTSNLGVAVACPANVDSALECWRAGRDLDRRRRARRILLVRRQLARLIVAFLCALVFVVAVPGYSQTFPPLGDDVTTSLGSFRIQISNTFAGMFNGCHGYNATTHILQSPTLIDQTTVIGRSNVGLDDGDRSLSPFRRGGAIVGTAEDVIPFDTLIPPAGFSCYRDRAGCFAGTGTRQVVTEIRSLKLMAGPLTNPVVVRAGSW